MDLEILEALALSDDRASALSHLLPGSEDHDYYRCLHAQHAGALDDADAVLKSWPARHGETARYERLVLRQKLCRLDSGGKRAADKLRDHFGVSHAHEAEADDQAPARPTRLPPGLFDGARMLAAA